MRVILLLIVTSTVWTITAAADDLDHKCIRMTVPFSPKTDMDGGTLFVLNANSPNSMSPLLIIAASCSVPQDDSDVKAKDQLRQKFEADEESTKSLCLDTVDQKVIQHRERFSERRFACTQKLDGAGDANIRVFTASSLIDLDGHLLIIAYAHTLPRPEAERQFTLIVASLRSR